MSRPVSAVLIAVVLVAGVAGVVVFSFGRHGASDPARAVSAAESAIAARLEAVAGEHSRTATRLEARIAGLEGANERLSRAIEEARASSGRPTVATASDAADDVLSAEEVAAVGETETAETERDPDFDFDASVDVVLDRTQPWSERQKHWKTLGERGRIDDAVAAVEAYARANRHDADAQATLGDAYIQKLFTVSDIEKGIWTRKADSAYDQALAADDHHWGARFAKAINYSFNPPVFGLQPKAIEQFEILRGQQEERAPEPRFAETYLLLGNLYANRGDDKNAKQAWSRGLEIFPQDKDLRDKLGATEGAR